MFTPYYLLKAMMYLFLFVFLGLGSSNLLSQKSNLGNPLVDNYSPSNYNAGTQNWRLDMSPNGILYAANNEGLLYFDGNKWDSHPLPNGTITRSIELMGDSIFVGGQDEFGYFKKEDQNTLTYHSLWEAIPENIKNIEDIWDIQVLGTGVYFRNTRHIFKYSDNKISIVYENAFSEFLTAIDESTLLFSTRDNGIYEIKNQSKPKQLSQYSNLQNKIIIYILNHKEGELIFTQNSGIYFSNGTDAPIVWESNAQEFVKENKILSAIRLKNGNYAIGTLLGGLLVIDSQGKTLYVIDKSKGLQNNSISCILEDSRSNIWIGSYFGIDRVRLGSGVNTFYPDGELEGAVYDVELWDNYWWFGTSNGLYSLKYQDYTSPFSTETPKLIDNSQGQVWSLDIVDDQLFIGHHNGAFYVNRDHDLKSMNLSNEGIWKFIKLDNTHMAVGGYFGIYVFKKENQIWRKLQKLENFEESSRILITDKNGDLWMSHPYRGLFRFTFTPDFGNYQVEKYTANSGYECDNRNYVFSISGNPVVSNPCGIFRYSYTKDNFERDTVLNSRIATDQNIIRMFESEYGLWYIGDKETGVMLNDSIASNVMTVNNNFPHLGKAYVGGFENLLPLDANQVILCSNKGIKFYQSDNDQSSLLPELIIDQLYVNPTSKLITNFEEEINLKAKENDVTFEFRPKGLSNKDISHFEYKLEGLDTSWVQSEVPQKEYNNLKAGAYTFKLRMQDERGRLSKTKQVRFNIAEKWFNTKWARLLWFLLVLFGLSLLFVIPRKKYKRETETLVNKQQETEKKLEIIKQEKLEDEIKFKNNELASTTLHLMQKSQTINSLRNEIENLRKNIKDPIISKQIKSLTSLLRSDERLEDDWDKFSINFDQVHNDFLERLKDKHPQLTPKDRKLCAFLKMNLSTKEIAPLLNISIRGVEISRYRLRKKLELDKNINLTEFIMSL